MGLEQFYENIHEFDIEELEGVIRKIYGEILNREEENKKIFPHVILDNGKIKSPILGREYDFHHLLFISKDPREITEIAKKLYRICQVIWPVENCKHCKGEGAVKGEKHLCKTCGGKGVVSKGV